MSRATIGGDVPDAGTEATPQRGEGVDEVGALVEDADDADPNPAVVINRPPVALDDWVAYRDDDGEDVTVAEDNPAYDADSEVVVVAFREDLERAHPDWSPPEALELPAECPTYAFPPRRLRRIGDLVEEDDTEDAGASETTPADRLTDAQRALRERLEETSDVAVVADPDDPEAAVLAVEKLGATHMIDADGAVEGGPVADRLANVAAEYLGGERR
ncbi:hypothetical protein [Haloplanus natans]|uniref:hypothetical protein n=1 Tax=Haloplanus natans TaxID=376171 RepID=UPI0006777F76|nr:hypothetical protein [Haloplanus natans]